jgi:hypothetical protein
LPEAIVAPRSGNASYTEAIGNHAGLRLPKS